MPERLPRPRAGSVPAAARAGACRGCCTTSRWRAPKTGVKVRRLGPGRNALPCLPCPGRGRVARLLPQLVPLADERGERVRDLVRRDVRAQAAQGARAAGRRALDPALRRAPGAGGGRPRRAPGGALLRAALAHALEQLERGAPLAMPRERLHLRRRAGPRLCDRALDSSVEASNDSGQGSSWRGYCPAPLCMSHQRGQGRGGRGPRARSWRRACPARMRAGSLADHDNILGRIAWKGSLLAEAGGCTPGHCMRHISILCNEKAARASERTSARPGVVYGSVGHLCM